MPYLFLFTDPIPVADERMKLPVNVRLHLPDAASPQRERNEIAQYLATRHNLRDTANGQTEQIA
jgi:hypothetical protein